MGTVYGELTDDGREIILVGLGATEEIIHQAKLLGTTTPLFKATKPSGALKAAAEWPTVVQLAATFGTAWCPGPALTQWVADQAVRRTARPPVRYHLPPGLEPRTWQTAAAQMIGQTGLGLLTDEPGTGKTVSAILGLLERKAAYFAAEHRDLVEPILVVCPANAIDSWVRHFHEWAPQWRTIAWRGPKRHQRVGVADVYVTSYDTLRRDCQTGGRGPLHYIAPRSVVLDEFHMAKNARSERSKAVRRIGEQAACVIGLSGTPITHHPGDLWPILYALFPNSFHSKDRYKERYLQSVRGDYDDDILGLEPAYEAEFRTCLTGVMRRVAKADVLKELPPKVYSVRTVELPNTWRKAYDQFQADMIAELPDNAEELNVMSVLAQLRHLSTLACGPADVEYEDEDVEDKNPFSPTYGEIVTKRRVHLHPKNPSWKIHALLEILEERSLQSVLVFAPSRKLIMLAGAAAAAAGRRVGYIVGGQTARARTQAEQDFQAGKLDAMFATTGAGGVAITLTAASTEVYLQRPLGSLTESIQSEDRAHRIGQTAEFLEIIDIVAENTIDSRIRTILREHAGQLSDLVQDPRIAAELLGGPHLTAQKAS